MVSLGFGVYTGRVAPGDFLSHLAGSELLNLPRFLGELQLVQRAKQRQSPQVPGPAGSKSLPRGPQSPPGSLLGRPRSHLAGPSPDRRCRCAAAAGRRLPRRAGRSGAGARARRAGAAGPVGRASGPGATTPTPQARRPPPLTAMGVGEWGRPAAYKAPGRGPRGDSATYPGSGDSGLRGQRSGLGWGWGRNLMTLSAGVFPSQCPHSMPGTVLALLHTCLI